MLKGRRRGRYMAKRRAQTGYQNPCLTMGCHLEAGLGLAGFCRHCASRNLEVMMINHQDGATA